MPRLFTNLDRCPRSASFFSLSSHGTISSMNHRYMTANEFPKLQAWIEDYQIKSTAKSVKVCVNSLLMSKPWVRDESSTHLSIYQYVADDDVL